jgi:hypothetical protein
MNANYLATIRAEAQALDDGITLKAEYAQELAALDQLESDLAVLRSLGRLQTWEHRAANSHIARIRAWIRAELAA